MSEAESKLQRAERRYEMALQMRTQWARAADLADQLVEQLKVEAEALRRRATEDAPE